MDRTLVGTRGRHGASVRRTGLGALVLLTTSLPVPAYAADESSGQTPASHEPTNQEADQHYLKWRDEWPRFRIIEYGITVNLLSQLAFLEFGVERPVEPNWRGGVLFDDAFRDAMRLSRREDRELVGDVSDAPVLILQAIPLVIDSAAIPIFVDDFNFDVAWQMTMMNLEAMGAVGFFNRFGHRAVARERPTVEDCRRDSSYDKFCGGTPNASFPSGHVSGAFLGVGMSCAHHVHLPIYGGGWPDVVFGCALPIAGGTSVAVARLMADRHYATDVLAGALVGFAGGFGLPTLLHYGYGYADEPSNDAARPTMHIAPLAGPDEAGIVVGGLF